MIQTGVRGLTAQNLVQEVLFLHSYQKRTRLLEVLRSTQRPPVLVFANSIFTVNEVTRLLREEQFHVAGLHSEMEQTDRFAVMAAFRKGERCTDSTSSWAGHILWQTIADVLGSACLVCLPCVTKCTLVLLGHL